MLSEEEKNLILQYNTQTLSQADERLFIEKIMENGGHNEFAQTLQLRRKVEQILQNNPVMKARLIVEKLGDDLFFDTPNATANTVEPTPSYSLNELLEMFKPVNAWETAAATRNSNPNEASQLQNWVVLPENGVECSTKDQLNFDLDQAPPCHLECRVYNSHEKAVLIQHIPAQEVSFVLVLSLPPGRYYWELVPTDRSIKRQLGTASGWFFVGKALMPDA